VSRKKMKKESIKRERGKGKKEERKGREGGIFEKPKYLFLIIAMTFYLLTGRYVSGMFSSDPLSTPTRLTQVLLLC
jgi:hypothetical protein